MPSVLGYHKSQNTSNQPKKYNSFLTFQAVDKSALKKLPFEQKLARIFTVMKQTDLIVTGQSMKDIQKGLSKTVAHYADSVKRLIFVENKKFGVPLAFTLTEDDDGEYKCVNLGDKNILLSTEDSEPSVLHPLEAKSLLEGDVVIGKKDQIVVESSIGHEDMLSAEPGDYEEL